MLTKLVLTLMLVGLAGFMPVWRTTRAHRGSGGRGPGAGTAPSSRVERLEHDLKKAVARVQPVLDRYGYPAVFLTILVEGVGIPAPGQTLLIVAALTAAHGHLSIVWVLILACTGRRAG